MRKINSFAGLFCAYYIYRYNYANKSSLKASFASDSPAASIRASIAFADIKRRSFLPLKEVSQ